MQLALLLTCRSQMLGWRDFLKQDKTRPVSKMTPSQGVLLKLSTEKAVELLKILLSKSVKSVCKCIKCRHRWWLSKNDLCRTLECGAARGILIPDQNMKDYQCQTSLRKVQVKLASIYVVRYQWVTRLQKVHHNINPIVISCCCLSSYKTM